MQKVTTSSAVQANHPVFSSRNDVALNVTRERVSHGAVALAAANAVAKKATESKRSAQVHTLRESSSRCTSQGETFTDWTLNRRDKYRLQGIASSLLDRTKEWGRNRVSMCSKYKLAYGVEGATLVHDEEAGRAWLEGLAMCDSPWTCAVCASRIGEEKADDVRRIEDYARSKGYELSLLTLTSHHTLETDLKALLDMQADALRLFWSGREAQRLKKSWGLIGTIRAFEITHSSVAGFHPHYHYMIMSERKLSREERAELAETLFNRWVDCSLKAGLSRPSKQGFDLKTGIGAAQYVAKWGLAREMSKGSTKVAKGAQSRNMWQLLSDATTSEKDAYLWSRYALATKGKSQQHWSPSLKAILKEIIEIEEAEEMAKEPEADQKDYLFINEMELLDLFTTDVVNRNWCNLYEIVEEFGLGYVRDYLRRRRLKGYEYNFFDGGREPFEFPDVD